MDAHERYEELAVGHVLGGLGAADAADFRSHLLACRDCRLRVAELRDIAADLAAAEREERSEARLRTEVAQRTAEADGAEETWTSGSAAPSRWLAVAIVAAVVLVGALAFWNLHLRTQVAALGLLVDRQDDALAELASGVSVAVDAVRPTSGVVVVDDEVVAFSFVDLPELAAAERYVVWMVGGPDGDEVVHVARTETGRVAGAVPRGDADELLVTVEDGPAGTSAAVGRELARADLTAAQAVAR